MSELKDIWFTRCPVPTPVGLALQLGWLEQGFAEAGVRLNSILDAADRATRESHFKHTLDWSFRHGGNVPPIRARSEGRPTRLVGITWTDEFQAIVARSGSGIAGPEGLRGRRVGVPRRPEGIVDFHRATALKGIVSALSLGGLAVEDVVLTDVVTAEDVLADHGNPQLFGLKRRLPYAPELEALIRGEIDAFYLKGTQGITVANLFGLDQVVEFGFHPDPKIRVNTGTQRVLTVDAHLADDRPDLVARLIAIIGKTAAWAESHPDDVRRFVAREVGASEETVLAAHGPDLERHLGLSLDPELVAAVASFKDFLLEWGFLAADFDVAAWVDARPWSIAAPRERHETAA